MRFLPALALSGLAFAGSAQAATVKVIVDITELNKGPVNVALCDKSLSQEGCPFFQTLPSTQSPLEFTFENIPPGRWAAVGYQDTNNNGEFDQLFKVPREPYALSNKAADSLVPTFDEAAQVIKDGPTPTVIRIKMQRLLGK
jgi:uncharacterized protein (DUF2141 family)